MPIGVAGLGLMGSSIATCLLMAGHAVTGLVQRIDEGAAARRRISDFLGQVKKGTSFGEDAGSAMERLIITNDISMLGKHHLIIESISESAAKKAELFRQLEGAIPNTAIIGTNTSAIPISLLQEGMRNPERLLGIHWGEPAHIGRFMEIICGNKTAPHHAERMMVLAESWGKEPSLVKKDIRGFISNRLMYALMRESFYLVENGYATYEDIDRACRNDLGSWITFAGPFRYMDLTGIPAYLSVMEELFPELNNAVDAPAFIKELVSSGAKGVSNASGFYPYTQRSAKQWEELFVRFSSEIRQLSEKYPQHAGDEV